MNQTEIYEQCYANHRRDKLNKLLRERAARWATARLKRIHAVRYWTNAEAQAHLEAAWLAGARSLDGWHRARNQRMFGVEYSIGVDGTRSAGFTPVSHGNSDVLVIPALGSRQITCVACGWPCNSVGMCSNLGCPGLGGGDA